MKWRERLASRQATKNDLADIASALGVENVDALKSYELRCAIRPLLERFAEVRPYSPPPGAVEWLAAAWTQAIADEKDSMARYGSMHPWLRSNVALAVLTRLGFQLLPQGPECEDPGCSDCRWCRGRIAEKQIEDGMRELAELAGGKKAKGDGEQQST